MSLPETVVSTHNQGSIVFANIADCLRLHVCVCVCVFVCVSECVCACVLVRACAYVRWRATPPVFSSFAYYNRADC